MLFAHAKCTRGELLKPTFSAIIVPGAVPRAGNPESIDNCAILEHCLFHDWGVNKDPGSNAIPLHLMLVLDEVSRSHYFSVTHSCNAFPLTSSFSVIE